MEVLPSQERRRQRHLEARRVILDAAESILVDDGFESLTMRRLAERCGYTAPTIYHYFGDKTGLIDALLDEVFRKLVGQLQRGRRSADPLEILRSRFHAFFRFALRNPIHYHLLMTPREDAAPRPPSEEEVHALLEEPFQELAEADLLRVDDIEAVKQTFWALLHGLISLQTSRPDYGWSRSLPETALEALIEGFIHRPPDSSVQEVSP